MLGFWIVSAIQLIGFICIWLLLRHYFPSYVDQKGKNLATKEDIKEITKKTEEVKILFQKEMAEFSTDLTFMNNYAFKRYSLLYTKIYGIVIQSEYLRFFDKKYKISDRYFKEYPFLEIQKEKQGALFVEPIKDEITSFNKKQLCDYIIDKEEYASPKLLKMAIAYRYAWSNYSGTTQLTNQILSDSFNISELELIQELIVTTIKEYNELRKTVKLSYNKHELEYGELDPSDFK
ncbi:hypothetical protein [Sporolactobacillus terrae]|uniref:hypothetical protein n=1 Tax=Sporolactobacillus terrae TaxID=269673 RepID=UPI001CBD8F9F|nr:hypothetical protein [Sporolactobacillus terrae]UAK18101.1 hypothetical protein K7399_16055 [Sporolactobacillus terrae]